MNVPKLHGPTQPRDRPPPYRRTTWFRTPTSIAYGLAAQGVDKPALQVSDSTPGEGPG